MRIWAGVIVAVSVAVHVGGGGGVVPTDPFPPGPVSFGRHGYVEYRVGDLPVILSAPHGGRTAPLTIPDRAAGVTATDTRTIELVTAIAAAIGERLGGRPHVIICHLRRSKVDVNRDVDEGAQGHPDAAQAWAEYHAFIDAARQAAAAQAGRGFYIDVHGHSHPHGHVELGYLLTAADLVLSDDELDRGPFAARTSLRTLAAEAPVPFSALLRGPRSLGGALQARGVPAVPSPARPGPKGDPYFSGGYSTERHGSRGGGPVSAVQMETPLGGIRDTAVARTAFARAFADALLVFLQDSSGFRLQPSAPVTRPRAGQTTPSRAPAR